MFTLDNYFNEGVMSVHFVADQPIVSKQGKPGGREMVTGDEIVTYEQIQTLIAKMHDEIEYLDDAFVEINNAHSQVLQIWPYRVVVVLPPLTKRAEITAVRPVTTRTLDQYDLDSKIHDRLLQSAKWVLITWAPWEGKSTFATAFVNELAKDDVIIKTIESPRDLQVDQSISQYSFSHAPHSEIRDILLLSRPDFTIYDEVRNKEDFLLFKDLRLTGIWLVWVMHATHAIDGVQRMLGTIEMGLIPQIIDTVIFIKAGQINKIFTLEQTVKTPVGMWSWDLARPVVVVKDLITNEPKYEMYSYGDSVVVMPLDKVAESEAKKPPTGVAKYAKRWIQEYFTKELKCQVAIEIDGMHRIQLYVPTRIKPRVIGKQWVTIQKYEKELWVSIDVKEISEHTSLSTSIKDKKSGKIKKLSSTPHISEPHRSSHKQSPDSAIPFEINEIKKWKKSIVQLILGMEYAHQEVTCLIWGKLMTFLTNHSGTIQIRRKKLIDQILDGEVWVIGVN